VWLLHTFIELLATTVIVITCVSCLGANYRGSSRGYRGSGERGRGRGGSRGGGSSRSGHRGSSARDNGKYKEKGSDEKVGALLAASLFKF